MLKVHHLYVLSLDEPKSNIKDRKKEKHYTLSATDNSVHNSHHSPIYLLLICLYQPALNKITR